MLVYVLLSCLFLTSLWLPARKGLTSWLSCILCFLAFCHFPKCVPVHIRIKGEVGTVQKRYFFCGSIICVFVYCVSQAFASVHCCLVVTCLERTDFLALVGDLYCIFVTFPSGFLGEEWYSIVSFPDLCRLSYFVWEGPRIAL